MYGTSTTPTKNNKYSDRSKKNNTTIFHYLASRLRVATVTARLVVISDAGALIALRIQNQNSLVLKMTNIRNGRSLYFIDQDVALVALVALGIQNQDRLLRRRTKIIRFHLAPIGRGCRTVV